MNRNFPARLGAVGIACDFPAVPGAHDFPAVQATLPILLQFLANPIDSRALYDGSSVNAQVRQGLLQGRDTGIGHLGFAER